MLKIILRTSEASYQPVTVEIYENLHGSRLERVGSDMKKASTRAGLVVLRAPSADRSADK
jgi:hypothetical protein